jgi:hypothetical protein
MRKPPGIGTGTDVFDVPRQHPLTGPRLVSPEARVFRILTSSTFRKGSMSQMGLAHLAPTLLSTINRRVRGGLPIQLTLMAFPFKVPNPAKTGGRELPDLAELTAIRRLAELARRIRAVYAPGLEIEIIHDGAFIAEVFGVSLDEVRRYETCFTTLMLQAGAGRSIRCHEFGALQRALGLEPARIAGSLERDAANWWRSEHGTPAWCDCFRKTLGMLDLRDLSPEASARLLDSARSGRLPHQFAEVEARVHRAMIGYRVKDAIIHQLDPRPLQFPEAIHATTRVQPNRLALWLVRRGDALLPWHGVGTSDRDGNVRVLTAQEAVARAMRPQYLPGETTPFSYADSPA